MKDTLKWLFSYWNGSMPTISHDFFLKLSLLSDWFRSFTWFHQQTGKLFWALLLVQVIFKHFFCMDLRQLCSSFSHLRKCKLQKMQVSSVFLAQLELIFLDLWFLSGEMSGSSWKKESLANFLKREAKVNLCSKFMCADLELPVYNLQKHKKLMLFHIGPFLRLF